ALTFTTSQKVVSSNSVNWEPGYSANPSDLEPAGQDYTGTLYVARARVNGQYIPWRGYFRSNRFYATVAYNGQERETSDCQALSRGGTEWQSLQSRGRVPSNAVLAGYDPSSHERTYVCRGYVNQQGRRWQTIGKVFENDVLCRLPYRSQMRDFEILIDRRC
ncbi:hypothetical protein Ocin01_12540, partial [Orchesella cincta]